MTLLFAMAFFLSACILDSDKGQAAIASRSKQVADTTTADTSSFPEKYPGNPPTLKP